MHDKSQSGIADIFRIGFEDYVQTYDTLPIEQYKVAQAIMHCRTSAMGGHMYRCVECGHELPLYNSCRNRHCPTCQGFARMLWTENRIQETLPVPYYHVVFTVPSQLRDFALRNRTSFYAILFRAASETLLQLAKDPKRLGGKIGILAVLHTWTQTIDYHSHIHCILPGGAISNDKKQWIGCKDDFLFPIAVVKKLYKGKMMAYFQQAIKNGDIGFHGELACYDNPNIFSTLIANLYSIDWNVHIKPPFSDPENVVKYISRYVNRVAISNDRIKHISENSVTFSYTDRKDNNTTKLMSLTPVEFIRRFMSHLVPQGFMKIRYYGFLANKNRGEMIPLCMELLGKEPIVKKQKRLKHWYEIIKELTGKDPRLCPCCGKGLMKKNREISSFWETIPKAA